MKEILIKKAKELRKLAKENEEKKMQKCARVMLSASALVSLVRKIRGA